MSRRGHKYGAVPTVVDGIRFASKAEAARYAELRLLEKAGQIARLKLQQRFELVSPYTDLHADVKNFERIACIGYYVADFCYDELTPHVTRFVVEDVKGFRTQLYEWKRRHFEAQYGIAITEIGRRNKAGRSTRGSRRREVGKATGSARKSSSSTTIGACAGGGQ